MRKLSGCVAASVFVATLCVAGPATAVYPGTNGRIAYLDPGVGIYTVAADGTGPILLHALSTDEFPSFSPNGKTVVFDAMLGGDTEILRVPAAGGVSKAVTHNSRDDRVPSMGPGGRIVFSCRFASLDICMVRANGSDYHRVTTTPYDEATPRWSPSGKLIVFSAKVKNDWDIFTIRPDGTGRFPVTRNDFDETEPDFSPNGGRIVFASEPSPGSFVLNSIRRNGTGWTSMSTGATAPRTPTFSPDGTLILFATDGGNVYTAPAALGPILPNLLAGSLGSNVSWQST